MGQLQKLRQAVQQVLQQLLGQQQWQQLALPLVEQVVVE